MHRTGHCGTGYVVVWMDARMHACMHARGVEGWRCGFCGGVPHALISTVAGVVFAARSPKSPSILFPQHACLSESVTAFGQDGLTYTKATESILLFTASTLHIAHVYLLQTAASEPVPGLCLWLTN